MFRLNPLITKKTLRITLGGMLAGIGVILGIIETWISFPPFNVMKLTFDVSLAIFIITALFCGLPIGVFAVIIKSLLRFTVQNNYVAIIFTTLFNLTSLLVFYFVLTLLMKRKKMSLFNGSVLALLVTAVFGVPFFTIINGILFTPWMWYFWGFIKTIGLIEAIAVYEQSQYSTILMLGIPKYWDAIWATHTSWNAIKYVLIMILFVPLLRAAIEISLRSGWTSKNLLKQVTSAEVTPVVDR